MSTTTEEPGIGHNLPDAYSETLTRVEALIDTANKWIETVDEINTEDRAGRAKDFRDQLRSMKQKFKPERDEMTKPFREKVAAINAKYSALEPYIDKAFDHLSRLLAPWFDKLDKQKAAAEAEAREKAERKRAEAEDLRRQAEEGKGSTIQTEVAADQAEKDAAAAEKEARQIARAKVGVMGDYSKRSTGTRTTWKATVTDIDKAFDHFRDHKKVKELLESLGSAEARGGRRRLPGFKIEAVKSLT